MLAAIEAVRAISAARPFCTQTPCEKVCEDSGHLDDIFKLRGAMSLERKKKTLAISIEKKAAYQLARFSLSWAGSFWPIPSRRAQAADPRHVMVAGHSMGGHGAWHLATTIRDNATALIPAAGWLSKEVALHSNINYLTRIGLR